MGPGASSMIAGLTPSPGGMFNHPRGTSLERLSGWIRNTGEAASAPCRARANRCCVHTTAEGDSDGTHSDAVPPGTAHSSGLQAVPVDLPAGQASGHGWGPLEFGMSDHPAGPVQHACGLRDGKFYKSPKR